MSASITDKNKFMYILIAAFVIFVIIYLITHYNTSTYEDYLYGFWVAEDDAFCDDAEIDSLLLFIGRREDGVRNCYIVVTPDISNQPFTLTHSNSMAGPGVSTYKINAEAKFEEDQLWDDNVTIECNMVDGTMRVYSGDTLYVRATKHHDITNISNYLDE